MTARRILLFCLPLSLAQGAFAHSYEGQAHLQAIGAHKPHDPDLFVVDDQQIFRATYREAGVMNLPAAIKAEYAFYLVSQYLSGRDDLDHLGLLFIDPRHRSLDLDVYFQNETYSDIYGIADRLNLRFSFGAQKLVVGRAPIDLSKSFIFRPNDLFAPQSFNNLDPYHKTGVDGMQLSGPIAPLGEWKLIAVSNWDEEEPARVDFDGTYIKPQNKVENASVLASYLNTWNEYSFQLIAGTYRESYIIMGNSEGEISDTLGLRVEGKQLIDRVSQEGQVSFVLGLDYRYSESLLLVGEYFLNGEGLDRIEDAEKITPTPYKPLTQLGRNYLGTGFTYDWTGTLKFRGLVQLNLTDQSSVVTGGISYSWNEKMDLSLAFLSGQGTPSREGVLQSEYGVYPQVLAFETVIRW